MNYLTLGGVTVGICILAAAVATWWPGIPTLRKDPLRPLGATLPFLFAWAYGVLVTLGVGGVIGWLTGAALWISNWLGDVALVWGIGVPSGQRSGAGTYLPLTQTGSGIVLILTVIIVVSIKKSKHGNALKAGSWCGICLGTSAGVAGLTAVPLAQAANWLGAQVYGVIA